MTMLFAQYDCEDCEGGGPSYDADATVRISNPDAENGLPTRGPLSWLNSARITADLEDDAVHCVVSIGDPRGGFCFTVRRLPDGRIVIHTPTPGEGMAHMPTRQLHEGTLEVCGYDGKPQTFEDDPEPWADDVSRWSREQCTEALGSVCIECGEDEPIEDLREAVAVNLRDGTLNPDDWNLDTE